MKGYVWLIASGNDVDLIAFLNGPFQGSALATAYNRPLVLLSYVVASFAAYTALDFAARVSKSGGRTIRAKSWLAGGACAMGTGIWGMHFVAMLAYRLPIPVRYDLATTLLSWSVAVLLSGFALALVTRRTLPVGHLLAGGAAMGLGVVTMHYTGMVAMRLEAVMLYEPWLFALSVLNAIVCSTIALWLVFHLGAKSSLGPRLSYKIIAALVMGIAIAGMHYMAMYAGICVSAQPVGSVVAALDPELQVWVIFGVALLFVSVLLAFSVQNHNVSRELKLQNERLLAEIAERTRAERALIEARNEADSANRAKSQFLANMSHEIRTPMNGVIGLTDLLLTTELDDKQRKFVRVIERSAAALLDVINDILDLSKIEAGKIELEQIDFSPRELIAELTTLLATRAQAKGLHLELLVKAGVPDQISGDPTRLRQVLTNLIGNAIKFSHAGTVAVEVTCAGDGLLRFVVRDTGIGISAEQQVRLFRAFSQADGSTTRKYGGTGLGLAIAKNLVQLAGGTIGVDSTPGAGSTFWFTLPFPPLAKESDASVPKPQVKPAAAPLSGHVSGQVLPTEGNAVYQAVTGARFNTSGRTVTVARDHGAALAHADPAAAL